MIYNPRQILFGLSNQEEWDGLDIREVWKKEEVPNWFLVGICEGKKNLKDLGVDGRIILKCIFKKWDEDMDMDWSVSR